MDVTGWRKTVTDRDAWKLILKEDTGPTWTIQPTERKRVYTLEVEAEYGTIEPTLHYVVWDSTQRQVGYYCFIAHRHTA